MAASGLSRARQLGGTSLAYLAALLFIAPIAWTALSSLKPADEAAQPPIPPWPTSGLSLDTYSALNGFGDGIWTHFINSLTVAAGTVVLTCIVSLLAGYGFSRFRFPLRNILFVGIMVTIMIPFQSILTPLFLVLSRLGLQNSLPGLMLVYVTLQLPFSVFMMRNAFDAVPTEIDEAARLDGCSDLAMLPRVLVPLVRPSLITVGIFAFLASWSEFLAALVFLSDDDKYTLPVLMSALRSGLYGSIDWGAVQAGVTVMMVPCLVIFLVLQRYYARGLAAGAVK
jgi:multiple sugar transport system permease protein